MKILLRGFFGDEPTNIFLIGGNQDICKWVKSNLSKFNLNEEHSCIVTIDNDIISIRGDEDYELLKIHIIEPINLNV